MQTLTVDLADRSYPIIIGQNVLNDRACLEPVIGGKQLLLVTNETIAKHYLDSVLQSFSALATPPQKLNTLVLPDGEQYKNFDTLQLIFDRLLEERFDRKAVLVALGGGVVGDMVGFAAACYQRGVAFIQVPTTILAQVDSSVGGKTAVNHPLGKNMIGAFHQPEAVFIDLNYLGSLPQREIAAGLAEVIKYGLIHDRLFFEWLETNIESLINLDLDAMEHAIKRSCEIKAEIVGNDEREAGQRALLNLGHTYGHAIESAMGYGNWLHGEAVAAGMVMACDFSVRLGWLEHQYLERTIGLLERANLPVKPPATMTAEDFLRGMSVDKKIVDGRLRLVLLKNCGNAVVSDDFDRACLEAQLNELTYSQ